jgi:hypothetical protein
LQGYFREFNVIGIIPPDQGLVLRKTNGKIGITIWKV